MFHVLRPNRDQAGEQRHTPIVIQHRERVPNYDRGPLNRFSPPQDQYCKQRRYYQPPMQVFPYGAPVLPCKGRRKTLCQNRAMAAVRSAKLAFSMIKRNVEINSVDAWWICRCVLLVLALFMK